MYPFAKLHPITIKIAKFLTIKRRIWYENWDHAIDEQNYDVCLSLVSILNEWKEREIHNNLQAEDITMTGKLR